MSYPRAVDASDQFAIAVAAAIEMHASTCGEQAGLDLDTSVSREVSRTKWFQAQQQKTPLFWAIQWLTRPPRVSARDEQGEVINFLVTPGFDGKPVFATWRLLPLLPLRLHYLMSPSTAWCADGATSERVLQPLGPLDARGAQSGSPSSKMSTHRRKRCHLAWRRKTIPQFHCFLRFIPALCGLVC